MATLRLNNDELDDLRALHKELGDKRGAYRVNAVILLANGLTIEKTAEYLLLSDKTVSRILNDFRRGGIDLVLETDYQGGHYKMTVEQEILLSQFLDKNLVSTAAEAVAFVQQEFGIQYTSDGMVITLHRLDYNYKKTKLRPKKADIEKQIEHVAAYEDLRTNMDPTKEKLYHMDAVHPTHNVRPDYAWIRIGEEREVDCNTGRERVNINAVYSPQDHEVIAVEAETVNSQTTIELFKKIEAANPTMEHIWIICDNARYYFSEAVEEYLLHSKIMLWNLPTYSPNLNLIERLWKLLKKRVIKNRYYGTFGEFKGAVMDFLSGVNKNADELSSLMSERFHIFQG